MDEIDIVWCVICKKCHKSDVCVCAGIHYRKSCASSGACLIASSGYQQFCTGKVNSVCITCCNTPLCNGPRHKRRALSCAFSQHSSIPTILLLAFFIHICLFSCSHWHTFTRLSLSLFISVPSHRVQSEHATHWRQTHRLASQFCNTEFDESDTN